MTQDEIMRSKWVARNADGKVYIVTQELYKYLHDFVHLITTDSGNIYLYDGSGVWKQITPNTCKGIIKGFLPIRYRTYRHWNSIFEEFMTDLSDVEEKDFNSDENIINFQNGILDLRTMELNPHSPKCLSTIQIPCSYKPDLNWDNAPVFKKYLTDLLGDDEVTKVFLLEFLGAIIANVYGWRYKKMLLMVGDGNTGKSVFRELAMHLVGLDNCVSIELKRLGERFGSSALYGKRLAGSGDLGFVELPEVNIIKQLTGGDELFAEFKGKDSFTFRYDGFLWCNCNRLPYFRSDRGQWVYSRYAIVRCNNVIPPEKQDKQLLDKLIAEKEAIVNIALQHFRKTIERGYRFTESESMRVERERYTIENNSLLTFVKERCVLLKGYTKRAEFNEAYVQWCQKNLVKPERQRDIGRQLAETFGITATKRNGYFIYNLSIPDEDYEAIAEYSYNQLKAIVKSKENQNNSSGSNESSEGKER